MRWSIVGRLWMLDVRSEQNSAGMQHDGRNKEHHEGAQCEKVETEKEYSYGLGEEEGGGIENGGESKLRGRGVQLSRPPRRWTSLDMGHPIAPTPPLQSGEGGRSKIASCSVIIAVALNSPTFTRNHPVRWARGVLIYGSRTPGLNTWLLTKYGP